MKYILGYITKDIQLILEDNPDLIGIEIITIDTIEDVMEECLVNYKSSSKKINSK